MDKIATWQNLLSLRHISKFQQSYIKNKVTGCWEWNGGAGPRSYGSFFIKKQKGKSIRPLAHRVSYFIYNGFYSDEFKVCHKCDNPECVNPSHLFLGTQLDNLTDCKEKGRFYNQQKTHCKRGHEFTESNIYWTGRNKDRRECLLCKRAYKRSWRQARRQKGLKVS